MSQDKQRKGYNNTKTFKLDKVDTKEGDRNGTEKM